MPFTSDSLHSQSREEFCLALRATRERKQVTLAQIAQSTKIPAYMFAALERGDMRRWPKGLFRRSFFRDYAGMIGVPVSETCAEFVLLFPDDEGVQLAKAGGAASDENQANDIRLLFDESWHGPRASVLSRSLAALIDAGGVILVGAALAWMTGMNQPLTIAIVALAYFSLATALVGESPAKWALSRRQSILDALMQGPNAIQSAWRRGSSAITELFPRADGGTPESAPSRQLRVRIKPS